MSANPDRLRVVADLCEEKGFGDVAQLLRDIILIKLGGAPIEQHHIRLDAGNYLSINMRAGIMTLMNLSEETADIQFVWREE